jgi:hypothetical protein
VNIDQLVERAEDQQLELMGRLLSRQALGKENVRDSRHHGKMHEDPAFKIDEL